MADHWYDEEGRFREDITDLRKARAGGSAFFVGASSIAKRLPAPFLTSWLQREAAKAAVRVRRLDEETLDSWAARAVEESLVQVQEAANTGTDFHEVAEAVLLNKPWEPIEGLEESSNQLAQLLQPWAGHLRTEFTVQPYYGSGGRCDGFNPHYLVDYKSQDLKDKAKPEFWPSYIIQKCVYREALNVQFDILPRPITIVVSRTRHNQGVWIKEWNDREVLEATLQAHLLTMSWLVERNYRLDIIPRILRRVTTLLEAA